MREKNTAPLLLLVSALLWSFGGVLTKYIPWNGVTVACVRGCISLIICLFLFRRTPIKINKIKALYAFCYFAQGALFLSAYKFTTAANATVLQNTSPLYIILFNALLFKIKPTRRDLGACFMLLTGVVMAALGNMGGGGMIGNALALVSALFYAAVFFLSKVPGLGDPMESVAIGSGFYLLLIPFCFMDQQFLQPTLGAWAAMVFMGAFCGVGAWLCFTKGIRKTPALAASFITMLEPVMSPVWTFLILGERMSLLSLGGCLVVIGTLMIYNFLNIRSQMKVIDQVEEGDRAQAPPCA